MFNPTLGASIAGLGTFCAIKAVYDTIAFYGDPNFGLRDSEQRITFIFNKFAHFMALICIACCLLIMGRAIYHLSENTPLLPAIIDILKKPDASFFADGTPPLFYLFGAMMYGGYVMANVGV